MTFWALNELGFDPSDSILSLAEDMIRSGHTRTGDPLGRREYVQLTSVLQTYAAEEQPVTSWVA